MVLLVSGCHWVVPLMAGDPLLSEWTQHPCHAASPPSQPIDFLMNTNATKTGRCRRLPNLQNNPTLAGDPRRIQLARTRERGHQRRWHPL
jgi:hypothetical protein